MAHSLSSKKRIRQNMKRREQNRARSAALRKRVKRYLEALSRKEVDGADAAYRDVCKHLDREAARGLIHRNLAARRKSRLARRLNVLKQPATA